MGQRAKMWTGAMLSMAVLLSGAVHASDSFTGGKQAALGQWRLATSPDSPPPEVYVRNNNVRLYFYSGTNVLGFTAHWSHSRVPTGRYKVVSSRLRLEPKITRKAEGTWGRTAIVIGGKEWTQFSTNLLSELAPESPGHGFYYQGLLEDRLLYRDSSGMAHSAAVGENPSEVLIDRHFSIEETLQMLARLLEHQLGETHPGGSLFLLLAPQAKRLPQPLLLDLSRHQCVWLVPPGSYDPTERGLSLAITLRGISSLIFESHGVALLKNPVSSAARLCDLAVQTVAMLVRLPLPGPGAHPLPVRQHEGMDLARWEAWLDAHTGTRLEDGSVQLLMDGEKFFPRLEQAISAATNHVRLEVFIFDTDDVAVEVADQLKHRSAGLDVNVVMDKMGSLAAGMAPPTTPLPENFIAPESIAGYLRENSNARVRPFLNPWLSADHSKVYLVDGNQAWLGGMNVGREYRYEWHDLMVELRGPVVASLENEFRREWAHEGPLGDLAYLYALLTPRELPMKAVQPWAKVRLLPTKTGWKPFNTAVNGALDKAQSYIYAENPYLFDKGIISRLARARNRGVDVRVVLPSINELKAGGRSNLVVANYLLQHGVRVFFYPGMTHVKALLVDDWACVGSGNLNHLSLRVTQEHNLATSDAAFCHELKEQLFEKDLAESVEITSPVAVGWSDFLADLLLAGF